MANNINPNRPEWTAEENSKLYELIAAGLDDLQIGRILKKTAGATRARRLRLGIFLPQQKFLWTGPEDNRLKELWTAHLPCVEIANLLAQEFGRPFSKNAIVGRAHRLHQPNRKAGPAKERKPRVTKPRLSSSPVWTPPPPPAHNHPWKPFGEVTGAFCSFVQGEPRGLETLMCGSARAIGSYCAYHHHICHQRAR